MAAVRARLPSNARKPVPKLGSIPEESARATSNRVRVDKVALFEEAASLYRAAIVSQKKKEGMMGSIDLLRQVSRTGARSQLRCLRSSLVCSTRALYPDLVSHAFVPSELQCLYRTRARSQGSTRGNKGPVSAEFHIRNSWPALCSQSGRVSCDKVFQGSEAAVPSNRGLGERSDVLFPAGLVTFIRGASCHRIFAGGQFLSAESERSVLADIDSIPGDTFVRQHSGRGATRSYVLVRISQHLRT